MATTITRYVNTAAAAGGNGTTRATTSGDNTHAYQTFNAAQVAVAKDLVSSDEIYHFKCAGASEGGVGSGITLSASWVTDGTRYIIVEADIDHPTTPQMHTGVADTGKFHFRYCGTAGGISIPSTMSKVHFRNLQFYPNDPATSANRRMVGVRFGPSYANCTIFENCLFDFSRATNAASTDNAAITGASTGCYLRILNCRFTGFNQPQATYRTVYMAVLTSNWLVYNCTFDSCVAGIGGGSGGYSLVVKNCLFDSCTLDGDGANLSGNNNASTNASSIGTSPRVSQTFTFADTAKRLASNDTGALGFGVDLSGDTNNPVTTDWEGDARHASTPDIGWDEYFAAGAYTIVGNVTLALTPSATLSFTDNPVQHTLSGNCPLALTPSATMLYESSSQIGTDLAAGLSIGGEPDELGWGGDIPDDDLLIGDTASAILRIARLPVSVSDGLAIGGTSLSASILGIRGDMYRVSGLRTFDLASAEMRFSGGATSLDVGGADLHISAEIFAGIRWWGPATALDATSDGLLLGDSASVRLRVPVPDMLARSIQAGGIGSAVSTNFPLTKQGQGGADHELVPTFQGEGAGAADRGSGASSRQGQGDADVS